MSIKKRNAVFVELIVVILVFSLSILLSVQLFIKAHIYSVRSEQKNHALLAAQSAIECFEGNDPDNMKLNNNLLKYYHGDYDKGTIYYDSDWIITEYENDSVYQLNIDFDKQKSKEGSFIELTASVIKPADGQASTELVSLNTGYYLPGS